ncbi:MAG: hypothetical protein LC792_26940 [Actinobacteria bacterium]|nr:hypothetical protein [Actinomycetota bacterium]
MRKVMPATALLTAAVLLASGCGGTLEGKYRRGQITTSTTAGQRAPTTTSTTAVTTSSTVPTSGNAARQRGSGGSPASH